MRRWAPVVPGGDIGRHLGLEIAPPVPLALARHMMDKAPTNSALPSGWNSTKSLTGAVASLKRQKVLP